ncbi:hypothetical protein S83_051794 [Arachis hypogaea]
MQLSSVGGRLVISSDGVWDSLTPEVALDCCRGMSAEAAAPQIVNVCLSKAKNNTTTLSLTKQMNEQQKITFQYNEKATQCHYFYLRLEIMKKSTHAPVQRLTGNLRIFYSALARGLIPLIGRHFLNSINMLMKQMIYSSLPQRYIDYLFLGDYVDRGQHSLETITLLLALKLYFNYYFCFYLYNRSRTALVILQIEYPENVHLIRGNHEAADINALFGFRIECIERMNKSIAECGSLANFSQELQKLEEYRMNQKSIDLMELGITRFIAHISYWLTQDVTLKEDPNGDYIKGQVIGYLDQFGTSLPVKINLGIYLKDKSKELSILVDRSVGGSSIKDGQLELIVKFL